MRDGLLFVEAARQQGYAPAAAEAALAVVAARLGGDGLRSRRFFCFRSPGGAGAGAASATSRPRTLLLFRSADDALGFAQARGLATSPRLSALSLNQALVVLVQRPAIGALLLAAPGDELDPRGLPRGVALGRDELLALLAAPPA